ncbi:MAG: pseudouridine-5'-phosphate glycosidase [Deinococcota bacterium]
MKLNLHLNLHPEVQAAIVHKQAVVALESTIISHGMRYPQNVETAKEVESIIRQQGAIPATIAILDGQIKVGLNDDELELLATSPEVHKVSRRDLPYVISKKQHGATTVASTMIVAALAGITTFVTGGIGGVHRGAEHSFDISADLSELATSNVAVISAGVKSILDIGLTLEKLETLGVPVITYQSDDFPAFYSRVSGFQTPMRLDTPQELAALMHTKWCLGLQGGVSIANPVPQESEIPAEKINKVIEQAIREMNEQGIQGKEATPYLLKRISEITGGESLKANIALVKNNAVVGGKIAVAYADLQKS